MRHSSDGPTTPASPLRPSRRGPCGLSLTPRRFSHRPVFARLRLPTRRRARATWLVAYSAVTLLSTGPRESSGYDPKTSEDDFIRRLVYAVWSSQTFGVQFEGGVPKNDVVAASLQRRRRTSKEGGLGRSSLPARHVRKRNTRPHIARRVRCTNCVSTGPPSPPRRGGAQ